MKGLSVEQAPNWENTDKLPDLTADESLNIFKVSKEESAAPWGAVETLPSITQEIEIASHSSVAAVPVIDPVKSTTIKNTKIDANFLNVLFDSGEEVSISDTKYGTHSIPVESLCQDSILITPNSDKMPPYSVPIDKLVLLSLNPIKGPRNDRNCTLYRTFLIEMDEGTAIEQKRYIEGLKVPYSVCVFSGNKSLHYAITLKDPFSTLSNYNYYARWILNVVKKADQNTLNPSRCIRVPNAMRTLESGETVRQKLIEVRERISIEDLNTWLSYHPDCRPPKKATKKAIRLSGEFDAILLKGKFLKMLDQGINSLTSRQRNKDWFNVACNLYENNCPYDEAVSYLEKRFEEEGDFKKSEFERTIQSAYDYMKKKIEE